MSRYKLSISDAASKSTKKQAEYYRVESAPELSARWRQAVNDAARSLRVSPERGAPCNFEHRILSDMRWIPIAGLRKHMLFYRVEELTRTVVIVNVLHGARKLESELLS